MASISLETLDCDILVIGAGGAGLRAAIEASMHGVRTAVICKSLLGKASTVLAQGGIAAALGTVEARDGWRSHFRDTIRAGHAVNDWRMAQIHAQEAPDRLSELASWGALFDRTADGRIGQRHFGGHAYARMAGRADRTGLEIMRALQHRAARCAIDVHAECSVQRLLLRDGRVCGALVLQRTSGRFIAFRCKAVVLATGGGAGAWKGNSNPADSTGDGVAIAAQAGAELVDMEFVQFHPTAVVWPPRARGLVVSEAMLSAGAVLRNAAGRRFLQDHVPYALQREIAGGDAEADAWNDGEGSSRRPAELMPPAYVAQLVDREIREGRGTPRGGVWLDASRCATGRVARMSALVRQIRTLCDTDLTKEPLEVGPSCHRTLGGIRVEAQSGATSVAGLFAAGEAAAGLHGAGSLSGNALSGALVFGRRAGLGAAEYCKGLTAKPSVEAITLEGNARDLLTPLRRREGENPFVLTAELRTCMLELVGISRSGDSLAEALATVRSIAARSRAVSAAGGTYNAGWHAWLDLRSLIIFSESTILAALERKESRGSHARRDFPGSERDCAGMNVIVKKTSQGFMTVQRARSEMPRELKRLLQWDKTELGRNARSGYGAATLEAENSSSTG